MDVEDISDGEIRIMRSPADGRRRSSLHLGGGAAAVAAEGHMQHPIMRGIDGGGSDEYDGAMLGEELFDFIRRRLPRLPADDPLRPTLQALLPRLADALGRPTLLPVVDQQSAG